MQATQTFPTELLLKAQNVRVVFLDVDGVLLPFGEQAAANSEGNFTPESLGALREIIRGSGENTKIVLTGDVEQIDNAYIDETSNGLSNVVEKFKPSLLAGHVLMQKGERSLVATLASEVL